MVIMFGASFCGISVGDAFHLNDIRANGGSLIFAFMMIQFIIIFEKYIDNICAFIFVLSFLLIKLGILVVLGATGNHGDIIANFASGFFGILLG